jgi:D-lactate dehydrogenase (cytochrome)
VILPSGKELSITRGDCRFKDRRLDHPVLGTLELPELQRPQPPKNAAGLYIATDMDLIDLFIGSEGRLGLILDTDLILAEKPYAVASLAIFCDEEQFWALRNDLLTAKLPVREIEAMVPPCLEFLDRNAGLPAHPGGPWVLITSIEASSEKDLDRILETLDVLLCDRGVSPANTWGGFDGKERSKLREFRHLLPETVNRLIAGISLKNRDIHKISTDTAVPAELLRSYHDYMRRILGETGVEHVVFGHCGQGHLHANLIPVNSGELERAEKAVELMASKAVSLGGTVSAEHGTGKLKKPLLKLMYSQKELEQTDLLISRICSC